jgi:uncharacterized protein YecA (UPF0149 family)
MKKVIAILETGQRILTTHETAEKKDWWITHQLEVNILPVTIDTYKISTEPEVGNIMEGSNRFYRIFKSQKVLICPLCNNKANHKIGFMFYCEKHYRHLMYTRPIRRTMFQPGRNEPCSCGSGQRFKNCCIGKLDHKPRHFFNSLFMEDPKIVNSLKTVVN